MSKIAHSGCQDDQKGSSTLPPFFSLESVARTWYSMNLCADARPIAPSMSCGSRATQAKT